MSVTRVRELRSLAFVAVLSLEGEVTSEDVLVELPRCSLIDALPANSKTMKNQTPYRYRHLIDPNYGCVVVFSYSPVT